MTRRGIFAALAAGSVLCAAAQTAPSRRTQALHYYEQAVDLREALAKGEPDAQAYLNTIQAFRRVYVTSPASSKADDSLLAVGELQGELARRFGDASQNRKAAEAYEFLIREYPTSPLLDKARAQLAALPAATPTAVVPAPVALAAPTEAPVAVPGSELPQLTDVRFWSYPGMTRVVVDLEGESQPHADRLHSPERIYFDLPKTKLGPALRKKNLEVGDALAKRIRVAQTQLDITRVVVDLSADTVEYSLSTLANPPRVVLELREAGTRAKAGPPLVPAAKPAAPPAASAAPAAERKAPAVALPEVPGPPAPPARLEQPVKAAKVEAAAPPAIPAPSEPRLTVKAAAANSRGQRSLTRALGLKIARVVIDAGHGGHDTGTIGPTGFTEKELTLDLARRLGDLIADRLGSEVVLTREDDTFVPLQERTAFANEKQADLFISIHANSSRYRSVRGVETYYLNFTSDAEAMEVAARENAASEKSVHDLQDLVKKITQTEKIAESREFALQVQRSIYRTAVKDNTALKNRGVRKAPFVVLIGAQMPSVLAEVAFLSNPRDEKALKGAESRQRLAEALYEGVAGYARSLSRVEVAAKQ